MEETEGPLCEVTLVRLRRPSVAGRYKAPATNGDCRDGNPMMELFFMAESPKLQRDRLLRPDLRPTTPFTAGGVDLKLMHLMCCGNMEKTPKRMIYFSYSS